MTDQSLKKKVEQTVSQTEDLSVVDPGQKLSCRWAPATMGRDEELDSARAADGGDGGAHSVNGLDVEAPLAPYKEEEVAVMNPTVSVDGGDRDDSSRGIRRGEKMWESKVNSGTPSGLPAIFCLYSI